MTQQKLSLRVNLFIAGYALTATFSCLRLRREVTPKPPKPKITMREAGSGTDLVKVTSSINNPILSSPTPSKASLALISEATVKLSVKVVKSWVDGSMKLSLNKLPRDTITELFPLFRWSPASLNQRFTKSPAPNTKMDLDESLPALDVEPSASTYSPLPGKKLEYPLPIISTVPSIYDIELSKATII